MKVLPYFKRLKIDEERCRQCLASTTVEASSPGTIVAGVFILLRVLRLVVVDGKRVRVNEEAHERWLALNDSERYFALLEGVAL